ncbi:Glycosyltransferase Family 90 domain containing protein [Tulasnella sp. 403]|nr:Glycosyltransferase Family 90 domain containing protein [Tulasnella sp. 403]
MRSFRWTRKTTSRLSIGLPAQYFSLRVLVPVFASVFLLCLTLAPQNISVPRSRNTPATPASPITLDKPVSSFASFFRRRVPAYEDLEWGDDDYGTYAANIPATKAGKRKLSNSRPTNVRTTVVGAQEKRGTPSILGREETRPPLEAHVYRTDGLVQVNLGGSHPIYDLIQHSEKRWRQKMNNSSRTFREAVEEYRRRYHRMPPKGFDKWWHYVLEHNIQLPDEYDQIAQDLEPFWGLDPAYLIEQQRVWEDNPEVGSYTIVSLDHDVFVSNHTEQADEVESAISRAEDQLELLDELKQWLPDFRATFSAHDVPYQFIGYDMKSEASTHATKTNFMDTAKPFQTHKRGWAYACPETSPLRSQKFESFDPVEHSTKPKTFIWDHKKAMDPCQHPDHVHFNGFLRAHGEGPVPRRKLIPTFAICKTNLHTDILSVSAEMWTEDVGYDPPWHEKRYNRLLWRGSNTGIWFGERDAWNISQRVRLVQLANEHNGLVDVFRSTPSCDTAIGSVNKLSQGKLNDLLMNVGFTGQAIQCAPGVCKTVESTLKFKEFLTYEMANQWKYVIDVDGNGWSARFKRLMSTNSLVLKSTIFPEWFMDRIQPWVHYVPVKNDFSDLYDILYFFHGDHEGKGAHDDLAERIATQGKEWSSTFWRREDMVAYTFRLFLEYARVMSLDREAASFSWRDLETNR